MITRFKFRSFRSWPLYSFLPTSFKQEVCIMSAIRKELVIAAFNRVGALIDYNIHNDIHKRHEFKQQTILADESLTKDEKTEAIRELNKNYDLSKLIFNSGTKRICENCS